MLAITGPLPERWVSRLGLVSLAGTRVLCLVLDHAMRTRRCRSTWPGVCGCRSDPPARDRFLTAPPVQALADKLGKEGDLVLAMTYLGLRWSELAAPRVADVNLIRRRVHIVERATEVGGRVDVAAPKSSASNRYVAIPGLLLPMLTERIEGKEPDALGSPRRTAATCATGTGGSARASTRQPKNSAWW